MSFRETPRGGHFSPHRVEGWNLEPMLVHDSDEAIMDEQFSFESRTSIHQRLSAKSDRCITAACCFSVSGTMVPRETTAAIEDLLF